LPVEERISFYSPVVAYMRKIIFAWLCCATVLPAGCVPSVGSLSGGPVKSSFGYRISGSGDRESALGSAEEWARDFCEKEHKSYQFGRFVNWTERRMGMESTSYDLYFACGGGQVKRPVVPEPETAQKIPDAVSRPIEEDRQVRMPALAGKSSDKVNSDKSSMIKVEAAIPPQSASKPAAEVCPPEKRTPAGTEPASEPKQQIASAKEVGINRSAGKSAVARPARKRKYVLGDFENLAPPGEEEPCLLDGSFVEETLEK